MWVAEAKAARAETLKLRTVRLPEKEHKQRDEATTPSIIDRGDAWAMPFQCGYKYYVCTWGIAKDECAQLTNDGRIARMLV